MTDDRDTNRCAFCGYQGIEAKPEKNVYPECEAAFEMDDRGECIFVDPGNPRLPIEGIIYSKVWSGSGGGI